VPHNACSFALGRRPDHLDACWGGNNGGIGSNWWNSGANHEGWNEPSRLTAANFAHIPSRPPETRVTFLFLNETVSTDLCLRIGGTYEQRKSYLSRI